MGITKKDVEYIAHLSRLEITPDEAEVYTKQLSEIIEHVQRLDELDTENVEPTYMAIDLKNVFRKDELKTSIDNKKVFDAAPSIQNNGFKVPKII
ncbi:MAG: Asp-tRNA(Asn)/Glu-tRNA(Gln) amidotransferase subunit GatC [Candidatus Goldiibacteriota bacterium]